jgi:serine/threonine kinase PknH
MEPLSAGDPAEIGGYRLRARLGAGGMGRVYLASTPGGRPVALKLVRSELGDDPGFRDRFRQEIQAAQRVHGMYTAELLGADPDATPPWLVTAYVPGPSLEDAVADHGPVPAEAVPLLLAGVAEALQVIHSAGVVHRDLKPSNVLLSPDGPRVIDFGIARALEGVKLTGSGVNVGSPQFMAPEQIRALPVTPAIDIFALGSLAAFAMLGRMPFGDGNPAAVMHRVLHEPPDLDGCPAGLRSLIERCLAKEPADRPGPADVIDFCRAQSPGEPAGFPQSWLPGLAAATDNAAASGFPRSLASAARRHAAAQAASSPTPTGAELPVTPPGPATPPAPAAAGPPAPARPGWAGWAGALMYGAGILAVAGLIVGLVTVPALRGMIAQQHPGASRGVVGAAVSTAIVIIVIRGLVGAGMWLWAARDTARRHPWARLVCTAAFAASTLGLASSYLQVLSTLPERVLGLAGWITGLCVLIFVWLRRPGSS